MRRTGIGFLAWLCAASAAATGDRKHPDWRPDGRALVYDSDHTDGYP